jgi:hypothetical protein
MDLMDLLQSQLSDNVLEQMSQQIGAPKEQTANAASGIFATLVGGLANNATNEGGLTSLMSALDRDHDGSVLDDLAGLLGGMSQGNAQVAPNALNGAGILGHILGDRQETAAQQVSQSSGLNMDQIMKLMPILAPIVMGVLGRAKSSGGLDLGGLAQILMGSAQNAQSGGFGDLIGSVLGGVLGGGQQQQQQQGGGGLFGQILGGILGKR